MHRIYTYTGRAGLRITLFVWNNDNVQHVSRHGLSDEEVDEILDLPYRTVRTRNDCYMLYGRSRAGRYLAVVIRPLDDERALVITARDMSKTERRRFGRLL